MLYNNSLSGDNVLEEFGVATNEDWLCSDAGKRDRFAWAGDRLISVQAVAVASLDYNVLTGPSHHTFDRQIASGQVPINTLFSPITELGTLVRTGAVDPLLVEYMFDFMQVIYQYWFMCVGLVLPQVLG